MWKTMKKEIYMYMFIGGYDLLLYYYYVPCSACYIPKWKESMFISIGECYLDHRPKAKKLK